eukprot:TRINITY_DN2616_c0_g1_i8.p2 TRINITY_DN2616_c0_g1~~TRINITY_DN2616_c0_g1_i8.p2  ORF type:complete len:276 (+),score=72.76 TRINITY_DN2616_c0_g1_i8:271-1098(+)
MDLLLLFFQLDQMDENKMNFVVKLLDLPVEVKQWMQYTPCQNINEIYQCSVTENKEEKVSQQYSEDAKLLIKKLESIFIEIKENEEKFNQLDAATGDGDMGAGVASASNAVLQILKQDQIPFDNELKKSIQQIGQQISKSFGGTSGALYGAFFYAASSQFNSELKQNNFSNCLNGIIEGMKAIKEVGQTQIGDRTMIDSLEPAVLGAMEANKNQKTPEEIVKIMVQLARNGADKAAQLPAKKGRSFYLQGQEIGKKDPGCEFVCLWIELIGKYCF